MNTVSLSLFRRLTVICALSFASHVVGSDDQDVAGPDDDPGSTSQLEYALLEAGWRRHVGTDGSVNLYPPSDDPRRTGDQGEVEHQRLADQLRRQLMGQGWSMQATADGDIYYLPPSAATAAPPATGPAEQLRAQLEANGWVRSEAADGSLIYRMPEQPVVPRRTLAEQLRDQLEAHGWIGSTALDGSVVYRKPRPDQVPREEAAAAWRRQLRRILEDRGWSTSPAEGGGVFVSPTLPEAGQGAATEKP